MQKSSNKSAFKLYELVILLAITSIKLARDFCIFSLFTHFMDTHASYIVFKMSKWRTFLSISNIGAVRKREVGHLTIISLNHL